MICYPKVHGMKNKQVNVELFSETALNNMKDKNDIEITEFFPDILFFDPQ